jgi:signal peptidase II
MLWHSVQYKLEVNNNHMKKYIRAISVILIVFSFIGCDQVVKSYAKQELSASSSVNLPGGLARLQFAENRGYFLSIGSALPVMMHKSIAIVMTVVVLLGFVILLISANKMRLSSLIALSLLLAGSLGNLIDRLFNHGLVVDFLVLGTNTIHTGILNVADILITTGIVMLMILEIFHKRAA